MVHASRLEWLVYAGNVTCFNGCMVKLIVCNRVYYIASLECTVHTNGCVIGLDSFYWIRRISSCWEGRRLCRICFNSMVKLVVNSVIVFSAGIT